MLATYTAPVRTPLGFEAAAGAMRAALIEVLGKDPEPPVLALALGKTALETGRWSAMWCGNWGNVKCSDRWPGLFTCITLNEVLPAGVCWYAPEGLLNRKGGTVIAERSAVPPGHPQTRMRAFASPEEGALDYCRFVAGGRYRGAWALLLDGDAAGYVHALKQAGYFTADEAAYARGVMALQREFLTKLHGLPEAEPPHVVPDPDEVREWIAPQDIAELEAELADRYFDLLDMNRRDAHREMSGEDP
jgi:hypothetical protein